MTNTVSNYPYWSPQGAGSARRFAEPFNITAVQLEGHVIESRQLDVPQEIHFSQKEVAVIQRPAALIPSPQAPVQVPEPFTQSRSLLDYAQQTLGGSRLGIEDKRGQSGETDITGR